MDDLHNELKEASGNRMKIQRKSLTTIRTVNHCNTSEPLVRI